MRPVLFYSTVAGSLGQKAERPESSTCQFHKAELRNWHSIAWSVCYSVTASEFRFKERGQRPHLYERRVKVFRGSCFEMVILIKSWSIFEILTRDWKTLIHRIPLRSSIIYNELVIHYAGYFFQACSYITAFFLEYNGLDKTIPY